MKKYDIILVQNIDRHHHFPSHWEIVWLDPQTNIRMVLNAGKFIHENVVEWFDYYKLNDATPSNYPFEVLSKRTSCQISTNLQAIEIVEKLMTLRSKLLKN